MNDVVTIDNDSTDMVEIPAGLTQVDPMLAMIERVALNPDADIAKMRALLDMRREEEDRVAETAFNAAMADAQAAMLPVVAKSKNDQTNSRYAKLDAIAKAIDPIITKHGFAKSFGQGESPKDNHYRVTMELTHRAGHKKSYQLDVPVDATGLKGSVNKTATHALGSTMSYGRRYLKLLAFDIATGDDDDGNAAGFQYITEEQVLELQELLSTNAVSEVDFLKFAKIDNLSQIYASKFNAAKAAIVQRGSANA